MITRASLPFWIIFVSIILIIVLPSVIADGMFMDGMLYTCVARNLAIGEGSFWNPVTHSTVWNGLKGFHEHPPFGIFLQSIFFRIFGEGLYVEKIFILFTLIINSILLTLIWKNITKRFHFKGLYWLPLVLWIIVPVVNWTYQHAMLENIMSIFILASSLSGLKAIDEKNLSLKYIYLILTGIFIFLASFTKGLPGFFPLALFLLYYITVRDISLKKTIWFTAIIFLVVFILYSLLLIDDTARESLIIYVKNRLLTRISTKPTVDSRFYILYRLFMDILPLIIVTFIIGIFNKKKKFYKDKKVIRFAAFLFLFGLAGSTSLMLTKVQKAFYYSPTIPFFALSFSILLHKPILFYSERLKNNLNIYYSILAISFVFLVTGIVLSIASIGRYSREKDEQLDVKTIGNIIPENTFVSIDSTTSLRTRWSIRYYFERKEKIFFDYTEGKDYLIVLQGTKTSLIEKYNYKKLNLDTRTLDLYKKNRASSRTE